MKAFAIPPRACLCVRNEHVDMSTINYADTVLKPREKLHISQYLRRDRIVLCWLTDYVLVKLDKSL